MDYRYERGIVGNWKGYQVYIMEKQEYLDNQYHLKDDIVYVIADDGMRMVNRGYTIGYLSKNGGVTECDKVRYRPVAAKEEAPVASGMEEAVEINFDITSSEEYFAQFAGEVTKFFEHVHDPIIVE